MIGFKQIALAGVWLLGHGFVAHAQEDLPAPLPEIRHWSVSLSGKWDNLNPIAGNPKEVPVDFLLGLEFLNRMSRDMAAGGSVYLYSSVDNALELSGNFRYYWPVADILDPYVGVQLNYLTRDNGGFSIVLRPGLEIPVGEHLRLEGFGQIRYDIWHGLNAGDFAKDTLSVGVGLNTQFVFR